MYQKTICRTPAANSSKPLSIRLPKMPFNEKAAYVESVCACLIDSRFGPGRSTPIVICLSDRPELEPAAFYEMGKYRVPSYSILADSEMARRYAAAEIIEMLRELAFSQTQSSPLNASNSSPSTLSRGSP